MLVWRLAGGIPNKIKLWFLPNGWLVDLRGDLYEAAQFLPGYQEDPNTGIEFVTQNGVDLVRVGALVGNAAKTLVYGQSPVGSVLNQKGPGSQGSPMYLSGSARYRPEEGQDLALMKDPPQPPDAEGNPRPNLVGWHRYSLGRWFPLNTDLGTDKGGAIKLHEFWFLGYGYPGSRAGDVKENVFRQGL